MSEIAIGRVRHTAGAKLDRMPADSNNRAGIRDSLVTIGDDGFITGLLACFDQSLADEPHERVKPEHGLYEHVNERERIIATLHMLQLVSNHRIELRRRKLLSELLGEEQDGCTHAEHTRFGHFV